EEMSSYTSFILEKFPARTADLEFQMKIPEQWLAPDLPPASEDFSDPTLFLPLMLRVAPTSPIILAVAARPAYENGTILDWVPYLLDSQKFVPTAMGETQLGDLRAMAGIATQAESDIGPRHLRFVFFEDGGRLVNIFLTSPLEVERMLHDVWDEAMKSF